MDDRLVAAARNGDLAGAKNAIASGVSDIALASAVQTAIANNDLPVSKLLMEEVADKGLPRTFYSSSTIQTDCIHRGHDEMLQFLLTEHGEKPGHSLIITTLRADLPAEKKLRIVEVLRAHGADINAAVNAAYGHQNGGELVDELRQYGAEYTPRIAAELGRPEDVKKMVAEDPSWVQATFPRYPHEDSTEQMTLLAIALHGGHRELAHFLLEVGAPIDVAVYENGTLLHAAAIGGDAEFVKLLVDRGLDVNAKCFGFTPLGFVIRDNHTEAAEVLIDSGADVNVPGKWGAPLIDAVVNRNNRLVQRLIAAGANVNVRNTTTADTVLLVSVKEGNDPAAEMLIAAGADVNLSSRVITPPISVPNRPTTPLIVAVFRNKLDLVKQLLAAGADPSLTAAGGSETALDVARKMNNIEALQLLEQAVRDGSVDDDGSAACD